MKTLFCPAHIEFLLHCHTTPEPWPNIDAPVYQDLIPQLMRDGVIEIDLDKSGCYRTTPLGRAWVEALCRVERPRQIFVDEQGRPLE